MTDETGISILRPDPYEHFTDEEGRLTEFGIDVLNSIMRELQELRQQMTAMQQQ